MKNFQEDLDELLIYGPIEEALIRHVELLHPNDKNGNEL